MSASSTAPATAEEEPGPATAPASDPRLLVREEGIRGYLTLARRRVAGGELGPLPVVLGLVVIAVVFQSQNSAFLTPGNLSNLLLQIAATGTIATGVVLVLLLGDIDLSVGSVSGFASAAMAVLVFKSDVPAVPAVLVALLVGAAVGLFHGAVITRFGVPSFVVTLAGLIGWQGAQLRVLGDTGTIPLSFEGGISRLANTFFPDWAGLLVAAGCVALYAVALLSGRRRRSAAGLPTAPLLEVVVKVVGLAVVVLGLVLVLNTARGLPLAALLFVGLVVAVDLVIRRTRWGRSVLAVGGNAEAARRAGIDVDRVRLTVLTLAGTFAAAGGVLAASRLFAVNQASGSGDVLLNAIAAAVIGGTSLFGGRGSAWSALLGILVIGSISNGMDLLQLSSALKFMITGAVLLTAVVVDALSRRGRQASGRA